MQGFVITLGRMKCRARKPLTDWVAIAVNYLFYRVNLTILVNKMWTFLDNERISYFD